MSRSVWKGPFVDAYVLKKAEAASESDRNNVIKIWSRRSTILPQFVGLTFGVYNGRKHIPVNVTEEMIGQKFGEFSPTRTYYGHTADKRMINYPPAWKPRGPLRLPLTQRPAWPLPLGSRRPRDCLGRPKLCRGLRLRR